MSAPTNESYEIKRVQSVVAAEAWDITPFDIARFLAIMEHPEVKSRIFTLIDERERENADR